MFTHLSGWKSRVEIGQSAREGRLRQEWREAPHENDRVSIPVIFWSVLGLVTQSVERLLKPDALARLLRDTIDADHSPLSPRVLIWKGILAKIGPEPPNTSLAPKRLESKLQPVPPM